MQKLAFFLKKCHGLRFQVFMKTTSLSLFLLALSSMLSFCMAQEASQQEMPKPAAMPEVSSNSPSVAVPAAVTAPTAEAPAMTAPPAETVTVSSPSYHKYSSVHVDGPYIAIAFDDGPSPKLTPRLLDLLKEKGIKVTFFVIGENAAHAPEILAREAAEGHEIGNHTWDHPQLTKLSDARVQEEVNKTSDLILKITGKKPTLLRPPYGAMNARLGRMIEEQDGLKIVFWSVDPLDWKRPGASVVSQRLIAGAKPGAIMLAHDIQPGTIEAMPATIDALLAKGYKFVTVSELIAMESKTPPTTAPATTAPQKKSARAKKRVNKNS